MISYAQNFEDVMLNRAFRSKKDGFYIDIGAWHPINDSVTKHFYDLGWSGINIEPAETYSRLLRKQRPRDINLACIISDAPGTSDYWEVPRSGASTTLNEMWKQVESRGPLAEGTVRRKVETRTLADVCREHVQGREIDFLKIDVEGAERSVIRSADWQVYRPVIVLVEAITPFTNLPNHDEWEQTIVSAGYVFAYFDGLNRFYVREESKSLLAAFKLPPNVFDDFCQYKWSGFAAHTSIAIGHFKSRLRRFSLPSWLQ